MSNSCFEPSETITLSNAKNGLFESVQRSFQKKICSKLTIKESILEILSNGFFRKLLISETKAILNAIHFVKLKKSNLLTLRFCWNFLVFINMKEKTSVPNFTLKAIALEQKLNICHRKIWNFYLKIQVLVLLDKKSRNFILKRGFYIHIFNNHLWQVN